MKNPNRLAIFLAGVGVVLALGATVGCTEVSTSGPLFPDGGWIPDSGPITEEPRSVGSVTGLIHNGIGTVIISQGGASQLRVRAPENLQSRLLAEMQGGNLVISFQPGPTVQSVGAIEFYLTVVDLSRLELTGVGSIRGDNISTGDMTVIRSGVGEIDLQGLNVNRLDVTKSGVGSVRLGGRAVRQTVSVDGLGDYEAAALATQEAYITLHGASSARVQVSDRLDAVIHSSGSVYYYGNPAITRAGNGSGRVIQM